MARDLIITVRVDDAGATQKLRGLDSTIGGIGEKASRAGRALSLGLTAPIVGLATTAFRSAIAFESSFAGIRKTVSATEEQFGLLSAGMIELSNTIPVNVNELNAVGEAAGQLGIETDNILQFTETMAQLGVTTNLSSNDAATALARLANIMQTSQDQFDEMGATIVDLGNNFATTEAEIVDMSLRIAGIGDQIGLTEAQVLGFATAMSSVGIQSELGGSAISRVMSDMALAVEDGTDQLGRFSVVAGMTSDEFAQAFRRDASEAIVAFVDGLGRMAEAGKPVIGTLAGLKLDGIRVRDTMLRLAGAGDLLSEALTVGSAAWSDNSALAIEAGQRFATTESQLVILKNQFASAARELGVALLPMLTDLATVIRGDVVPMVQSIARWFADLSPMMQRVVVVGGLVAAAMGPVVLAFGALASGIAAVAPIIGVVGAALSAAFVVASGPVALATIAIGGLMLAIANWDQIGPMVGRMVTAVRGWLVDRLGEVFDIVGEKVDAVTGFFADMFDTIVGNSIVPDMVNQIGVHMDRLTDVMLAPAQSAIDGVLGSFSGAFGEGGILGGIMSGGMSILSNLAAQGMQALGGLIGKGLGAIGGKFKELFGGPNAEELAGREIVEQFQGNIAQMLDDTQQIEAGGELWKQVNIGVRDAYKEVGLSEQAALSDLEALYGAIKSGPDAVNPMIAAIQAKMDGLRSSIAGARSEMDALLSASSAEISAPSVSAAPTFDTGGLVGRVPMFPTGGLVGGHRLIAAQDGEFVMSRAAVGRMGVGGMQAINAGRGGGGTSITVDVRGAVIANEQAMSQLSDRISGAIVSRLRSERRVTV